MTDATITHFLERAKAYAALIGSLLTVLVTTLPAEKVPTWVGVVLAALTAFATWAVPNLPALPPLSDTGSQDFA